MSWYDTMVIPKGAPNGVAAAEWMNFVYDPVQGGPDHRLRAVHLAGEGRAATSWSSMGGDAAALAESPILFPERREKARDCTCSPTCPRSSTPPSPTASSRSRGADAMAADRRRATARSAQVEVGARTCCSLPRAAVHRSCSSSSRWSRCSRSRCRRSPTGCCRTTSSRGSGATSRRPSTTSASSCCGRSPTPAIATVLCLLIAYPLAYFIAFKAGRWRNVLLGLVMVPFFTSFLLRTIAWQSLLNDNGPVLGIAETLHLDGVLDAIGTHHRRQDPQHPDRGDRRAHLQLPAVHAAADLRQPGEDRHPPRRRRQPTSTRRSPARSAR